MTRARDRAHTWKRRSSGVSTSIVAWEHLTVTAPGTTVTFPASISEGEEFRVSLNQAATGTTLSGNGNNFYGAVTDTTLVPELVGVTLHFIYKDSVLRLL